MTYLRKLGEGFSSSLCTHLTQCAFLNWREEEEEEEGGLEWTLYGASVCGRRERSTGAQPGRKRKHRIVAECMSASQWEAAAAADQKVLTICWGSRHALALTVVPGNLHAVSRLLAR